MSMPTSLAFGRYQLGQLIGRGGMAEVHVATDTRLGRTVAIKIMRPDLAADQTFLDRFRREAHSVAMMNHQNIVNIYDSGEEAVTDENGQTERLPYLVMEYVQGRTLRDIIRASGPLNPRDAALVMEGVLAALDYSHRHGIIHRDIKPGNIMISTSGDVKVMDFGIARVMDDSATTMTQSQGVVGTAQYLSPEQARGESVDMRSDLYSAGCVLYEMLTGRPPFTGDSAVAIAYQHVSEVATPPSTLVPGLPKVWDAICAKAMAKDRQNRYATAAEFLADIRTMLNGGQPAAAGFNPLEELQRTQAMRGGAAGAGPSGAGVAGAGAGMAGSGHTQNLPPVAAGAAGGYGGGVATATRKAQREAQAKAKRRRIIIVSSLVGVLVVAAVAFGVWFAMRGGAGEEMGVVPTITSSMTEAQAEQKITDAGFRFVKETDRDSTLEKGMFTGRQDPKGGASAPKGSAVRVWFSAGPANSPVPDVVGRSQAEAREILEEAGFTVKASVSFEASDSVGRGGVTRTDPAAGVSVPKGTAIMLYVSNGMTTLPNVVGQTEDQARQTLARFQVTVHTEASDTVPAGQVTRMEPGADSPVEQGSAVEIWVSTGKQQVAVPECPATDSYQTCAARLETRGLKAQLVGDAAGKVTSLSPAAGTQVESGSTVTVHTQASSGSTGGTGGTNPGGGSGGSGGSGGETGGSGETGGTGTGGEGGTTTPSTTPNRR